MMRFHHPSRTSTWTTAIFLAASISFLAACSDDQGEVIAQVPVSQSSEAGNSITAGELKEAEAFLLDLAGRIASSLPSNPHLKTRSRLQESVVRGYLDRGCPKEAAKLAAQIEDWREAYAYAEISQFFAETGEKNNAQNFLNRAQLGLDRVKSRETQSWRLDRVKSAMAQSQLLIGDEEKANELSTGLGDTEWAVLDRIRFKSLPEEDFEASLKNLDAVFLTANLDQARTTLECFVTLRERFYAKKDWRVTLEKRISQSYAKLPLDLRLAFMFKMVEQSLAHEEFAEALRILGEAEEIAAVGTWLPEARIPFDARVAALRFLAGEQEVGVQRIQEAVLEYSKSRNRIVDIFRGQALRPLAEAFAEMGDAEQARRIYFLALEEAQVNPNSRPRAEDITALCLSMTRAGIDVDENLQTQLEAAYGRLGQPW